MYFKNVVGVYLGMSCLCWIESLASPCETMCTAELHVFHRLLICVFFHVYKLSKHKLSRHRREDEEMSALNIGERRISSFELSGLASTSTQQRSMRHLSLLGNRKLKYDIFIEPSTDICILHLLWAFWLSTRNYQCVLFSPIICCVWLSRACLRSGSAL